MKVPDPPPYNAKTLGAAILIGVTVADHTFWIRAALCIVQLFALAIILHEDRKRRP